MSGTIHTHIDQFIATVTFSHPQSNSFPSELLQKLIDTFDRLSTDDNVRVIVLQSEGEKTFCAGASFDELMAINDLESGKAFFSGFANLINAMRKCSKIIIGRVQGQPTSGCNMAETQRHGEGYNQGRDSHVILRSCYAQFTTVRSLLM